MNTTPFISDSLNKSEIFSGLSGQQLADVIKEGRCISLSLKRLLFYQDDPAISCFLVNKGRLKLTKMNSKKWKNENQVRQHNFILQEMGRNGSILSGSFESDG